MPLLPANARPLAHASKTAEEYKNQAQALDWNDLSTLWSQIQSGSTSGDWAAGKAFEHLIVRAFELDGATVQYPYSVTMDGHVVEQIDGVVYHSGLAWLIECKDTRDSVNIEPIAKLRNQLLRRPSLTLGSVFSRTGFTDPALTLAQFSAPQTILLWNHDDIDFCVERNKICEPLVKKFRHCIEHGLPEYNLAITDIP